MNDYALATIASPLALKRWSHAARYRTALTLLTPRPGERILDFGCGDGLFIEMLDGSGAIVSGYEPHPLNRAMGEARLGRRLFPTFDDARARYDAVVCMEVLEHVPDRVLSKTIGELRQSLAPEARLLISVPVEVGPVGLVKNIVRALGAARHPAFRWRDAFAAAVYRAGIVHRPLKGDMVPSHLGFDHARLRRKLRAAGFAIERECFGPLGFGGHLLNSQAFWMLRHQGRN